MSSIAIVVAVVIVAFIIIKAASRPTHANHAGLRIEEGRPVSRLAPGTAQHDEGRHLAA